MPFATPARCTHWAMTCGLSFIVIAVAPFDANPCMAQDARDSAVQSYLTANGLLNRGLYELAVDEYRSFLENQPDHQKAQVARYGLAVSLFRIGKRDAAADELEKLRGIRNFEFAAEVATVLGQCHLTAKRYAPAADAFLHVIRQHADHDLADDAAAGAAESLQKNGRHEDAIDVGKKAASRWPDSPLRQRWEYFCGLSEMALDKHAAAAKRFEAMLRRSQEGPFAPQASLLLARCYQHDNAVGDAVRQYKKILSQADGRFLPDALVALGSLLQQQDKQKQAARHLDRLIEKFPESSLLPTAHLLRGRIWFDQNRYDRALAAFRNAAKAKADNADHAEYWMAKCLLRQEKFATAAERLESASRQFPDSDLVPEMLYDRAVALLRAKEHDAALETLARFRSRFPDHPMAAESLQLIAMTEHQRGRYDASQSHSDSFLSAYPDHELAPSVAFLVGENEYLQERFDKAAKRFRTFLDRHPDDPQADKARFRLGTALFRLQKFDQARPILESVARLAADDPTFRSALLAVGDIHFQRSEWKIAETYLENYLAAGLEAPSADDALLKLSLARQRQGRLEDALRGFARWVATFDNSPHRLHAMFERGQILVELGRLEQAVKAFESLLSEDPDSRFAPYALNHLAAIAGKSDDFDRAAKLYERVARTSAEGDSHADAMLNRAQAYMSGRQFDAAADGYSEFLDRHSNHARATEARANLAVALARTARHEDALREIKRVERRSIEDLDEGLRDAVRYEKAWCLRELGRLDEAAEAYLVLIDSGSRGEFTAHALLELGALEADAERFDSAATYLRRLRSVLKDESSGDPSELLVQCTYRLGICEYRLERFEETADLLDEFVQDFSDSPLVASASFYCAEACFSLGKFDRAARHLQRVATKFDRDPVFAPSLLRLGECHAAMQRWAKSETVFGDYLRRFADGEHWYQAQFGIGWARENQKRFPEAVRAYRKVVNGHQGPSAARAQFQIGECLFAQSKFDEAVRELIKVDILYPYPDWSAAALFEAGRCFEKLNKTAEAIDHFRQVDKRFNETRWATLASQRLSELSRTSLPGK